ncbi:MAG: DoxX family membrane protein [Muribaculaceae bacterium]|nr:DoxX family membrane protein [Muribaculaceae bacterium]
MKTESKPAEPRHQSVLTCLLWLCRISVGAAFVLSGWSKAIDPWGFIYKIEEYLTVWQISMPRELILCGAVTLSIVEFITGISLLCGMLRRAALWSAAAMMAFMLPLTVYIAIADPVADCGCFGDFLILSNTATLVKNIFITAAIIVLFCIGNQRGICLFRPAIQWIALTLSGVYALSLAVYGYNVQPLLDFRPYPTGTDLAAGLRQADNGDEADDMLFVYSKDGVEQSFTTDNLPDSSWTFVRREESAGIPAVQTRGGFGIYDSDGEDLSRDLITGEGTLMLVVVADPGVHYLSRARFVNEVAMTVKAGGGSIIGLVGAPWQVVEQWADLTLPDFDVYSADDTELKSLVRGDAALVLLHDGKIIWKRTVGSLDADFTSAHSNLDSYLTIPAPDNGTLFSRLTIIYLLLMLATAALNFFRRK